MFRFVFSLALVWFFGLIQLSNQILILGIKPNLVLVLVIIAGSLSRNWFEKIILILVGAIAIKFHPEFSLDDILFIISAFAGITLVKYLRFQTPISLIIAVAVATILINIYSLNSSTIIEILMNEIVAAIIYTVLKPSHEFPLLKTIK